MSKVPAADNTLRILGYLGTQRGPVPAASIAASLGLPRSTVYHLLTVLAEHGFVLHFPEAKRYGLGVAAYELSSGFSRPLTTENAGRSIGSMPHGMRIAMGTRKMRHELRTSIATGS